jgi:hypothetical protein
MDGLAEAGWLGVGGVCGVAELLGLAGMLLGQGILVLLSGVSVVGVIGGPAPEVLPVSLWPVSLSVDGVAGYYRSHRGLEWWHPYRYPCRCYHYRLVH